MTLLLGGFLLLMLAGVPIAFAMIAAGTVYLATAPQLNLLVLPQQMQAGIESFPLLAVPFFLLAGNLMTEADVVTRILRLSRAVIGHIRGGLAHALVLTGVFLSGISGSGTADAAALGSVMIPGLQRERYTRGFAVALTACAGAMGPVIPPSIILIIFGAMGNVSVGQLYLGSTIPGLLMAGTLVAVSHLLIVRNGYGTVQARPRLSEQVRVLGSTVFDLLLPAGIIGGILFGIFTPTEAGAVAVAYVLLLGFVIYRTLTVDKLLRAARDTIVTLGAVMLLLAAAALIQYLLALHQVAEVVAAMITSISGSPLVFLILVNLLLLALGCLMEATAILVLVTPIVVPILAKFGIDPVHFGVVLCLNLAIGLVTPPVGLAMFVTCAIGQLSIGGFARAVWPYLVGLVLLLALVTLVPALSLWLPSLSR